jgi:hypothetical protein
MWKLKNWLFGWQYAVYQDSCNSFVFRVIVLPNGKRRMSAPWCCGHYEDVMKSDGSFVTRSGRWEPMTHGLLEE